MKRGKNEIIKEAENGGIKKGK
jgi:hypothetical protein